MPFKEGKSGNPAGRKKGAKGKRTEHWEVFSRYCLEGELEKFRKELDKLEGKEYVTVFLQLLEFHKPKLARSVITEEDEKQITRIIFAEHGASNGSLPKELAGARQQQ